VRNFSNLMLQAALTSLFSPFEYCNNVLCIGYAWPMSQDPQGPTKVAWNPSQTSIFCQVTFNVLAQVYLKIA
jgi:hypothetical protein